MKNLILPSILFTIWITSAGRVYAEITPESLGVAKKATALVVVKEGSGSGFCIHSSGLFVSSAHLFKDQKPGAVVTLVLTPGEAGERTVKAQLVRLEGTMDLALIRTEESGSYQALSVGKSASLIETTAVIGLGYPFGEALSLAGQKYPNISVNMGRITSLRKENGRLSALQLDAQLNPGNSGGPVLGPDGKVVGVVASGIPGTGINFAIPADLLREFLQKPEIVFIAPHIEYAMQNAPAEFTCTVASFIDPAPAFSVDIILIAGLGDRREFKGVPDGKGGFRVKASPVPRSEGSVPMVHLTTEFQRGSVVGIIPDQEIKVGSRTFKLSETRTITQGTVAGIKTRKGENITGAVAGLGRVKTDLGGFTTEIDLSKAQRMTIQVQGLTTAVMCHIRVRSGEEVVAEVDSSAPITKIPKEVYERFGVAMAGLVGHWRFDEGTGEKAGDSSGSNIDAEVHGAEWVDGKFGKALRFTERGSYVAIPQVRKVLGQGSISYSMWVNAEKWDTGWGGRRIYHCGDGCELDARDKGDVLHLSFAGMGGLVEAPVPPQKEWHHIATTLSPTRVRLYIDGKLAGEKSGIFNHTDSPEKMYIGTKSPTTVEGDFFRGIIDDVRIYNREIDPEEVDLLFRLMPP
jgi:hypothetical protein